MCTILEEKIPGRAATFKVLRQPEDIGILCQYERQQSSSLTEYSMTSLKKYWFGMNRDKQGCAKCPDSVESTTTSVTQSMNVTSSPGKSADCEPLLEHQCPAQSSCTGATIATDTPSQQVIPTDSNEMKSSAASHPAFISESTSQTVPDNALQKSTSKSKKGGAAGKKGTGDKKGAAEKKGADKKGAAAEKKAAAGKKGTAAEKKAAAAAKKADVTEKAATGKKDSIPSQKPDEATTTEPITKAAETTEKAKAAAEEPVVGAITSPPKADTDAAPAAKEAAIPAKAATKQEEEPVVGEEAPAKGKAAPKRGKAAKAGGIKEPKVGRDESPATPGKAKQKRKGAAAAEEPVVGEEEAVGSKERHTPRKEGAEEPTGGEEASLSPGSLGGRVRRRRKLEEMTTEQPLTETPSTTVSSLFSHRPAKRRLPFSKPLTFSSRSSRLDSLSEYEQHQSVVHEQELLRAWRTIDRRLLKMLPTPMQRPLFLTDPPDLGFEGTLTSEMRKEFAKRKIEAMRKPSMELVRDPLRLRFIQPKMNKCEILRKRHIRKEAVLSDYFERHYNLFQKPPFKNIRVGRQCY